MSFTAGLWPSAMHTTKKKRGKDPSPGPSVLWTEGLCATHFKCHLPSGSQTLGWKHYPHFTGRKTDAETEPVTVPGLTAAAGRAGGRVAPESEAHTPSSRLSCLWRRRRPRSAPRPLCYQRLTKQTLTKIRASWRQKWDLLLLIKDLDRLWSSTHWPVFYTDVGTL